MTQDSELIRILRDLLRFDTTNPPGNELACAQYLADLFRKEGIEPSVLESKPGRGNVIARLKGDGTSKPLLLSAHLDVVAATEPDWQHPPFAAEIHDGYVWGRGAVDMKHMAAMSALVLLELKRKDVKLKRDVVFAGVADEEAGGRCGAGWLVEHHRDLIAAEFCLTELGGMAVPMARGTIVPVQIAGRGFDPTRIDVRPRLGSTELWQWSNPSKRVHPMHLHGMLFRIVERSSGVVHPGERGWKDTIGVLPGETVTVQPWFAPYKGKYVFHCHALEHGDKAMMLQLEVVG